MPFPKMFISRQDRNDTLRSLKSLFNQGINTLSQIPNSFVNQYTGQPRTMGEIAETLKGLDAKQLISLYCVITDAKEQYHHCYDDEDFQLKSSRLNQYIGGGTEYYYNWLGSIVEREVQNRRKSVRDMCFKMHRMIIKDLNNKANREENITNIKLYSNTYETIKEHNSNSYPLMEDVKDKIDLEIKAILSMGERFLEKTDLFHMPAKQRQDILNRLQPVGVMSIFTLIHCEYETEEYSPFIQNLKDRLKFKIPEFDFNSYESGLNEYINNFYAMPEKTVEDLYYSLDRMLEIQKQKGKEIPKVVMYDTRKITTSIKDLVELGDHLFKNIDTRKNENLDTLSMEEKVAMLTSLQLTQGRKILRNQDIESYLIKSIKKEYKKFDQYSFKRMVKQVNKYGNQLSPANAKQYLKDLGKYVNLKKLDNLNLDRQTRIEQVEVNPYQQSYTQNRHTSYQPQYQQTKYSQPNKVNSGRSVRLQRPQSSRPITTQEQKQVDLKPEKEPTSYKEHEDYNEYEDYGLEYDDDPYYDDFDPTNYENEYENEYER